RQLESGLYSLGAAACEVHCAITICGAGKVQHLLRKLLGNFGDELAGVAKLELAGLLCHSVSNLAHAGADEIHRRATGKSRYLLPFLSNSHTPSPRTATGNGLLNERANSAERALVLVCHEATAGL